jgi:hypothetical protein
MTGEVADVEELRQLARVAVAIDSQVTSVIDKSPPLSLADLDSGDISTDQYAPLATALEDTRKPLTRLCSPRTYQSVVKAVLQNHQTDLASIKPFFGVMELSHISQT